MPEQVRYLQPGGRLGDAVPPDTAPASTFTYDPADPTPTIGGRLLSPDGGYRNDTKLAERADVLSFTSDALSQDIYVVGNPVIELSHSWTTLTMTCSCGSARWTPRGDPATSATDTAVAQRFRLRHH